MGLGNLVTLFALRKKLTKPVVSAFNNEFYYQAKMAKKFKINGWIGDPLRFRTSIGESQSSDTNKFYTIAIISLIKRIFTNLSINYFLLYIVKIVLRQKNLI